MFQPLPKIGRVIIWVAMGIVVLIAIAVLALQSAGIQQALLDQTTTRINATLDGEFRAERLSGSLLADATLHDVRLYDRRGNLVLRAEQVSSDYSLPALLFGTTRLDHLRLEHPVVRVRRYADEVLNLEEIRREEAPPTERRIDIFRISVVEGELSYDDETTDDETTDDETTDDETTDGEATGDSPERVATLTDLDAVARLPEFSESTTHVQVAAAEFDFDAAFVDDTASMYSTGLDVRQVDEELAVTMSEMIIDQTSNIEGLEITAEMSDKGAQGEDGAGDVEQFSGRLDQMTLSPRLVRKAAPNLTLASPVTVEADFSGQTDDVELEGRASVQRGGSVEFDGSFDPTAPSFDIGAEADDFELAAWLRDVPPLTFSRGDIDLRGDERRLDVTYDLDEAAFEGMSLQRLDGRAQLDRWAASAGEPTGYEIAASGSGLAADELDVESTRINLNGSFTRAESDRSDRLERVSARGIVGLESVGGYQLEAEGVEMAVDVDGPLDDMAGSINTDFDELGIGDQNLEGAIIDVDLRRDDHFRVESSAAPEILPQFPLFVRFEGSHSETFELWRLTLLELGRPEFVWRMAEPTRIELQEGEMTIDSLVLEHGEQSVSIDGTYSLDDIDSLPDLVEELGMQSLESLLDPDAILRRVPEELFEEIPEEIEEGVPEEIEEAPEQLREVLPERLREELPDPFSR